MGFPSGARCSNRCSNRGTSCAVVASREQENEEAQGVIVEDQSEVIAFLSRPETWGMREGAVARNETHASIVFLADGHAAKLKRAVRFPYLDYSTAERRQQFCQAEVEINRRTAPQIYRGVLPVVRTAAGQLALGGDGVPVDWVIDMARFDEGALFDRLAAEGRLDRFAMESLADEVAHFHADAERCTGFGGADGLRAVLDSNRDCFAETPAGILEPEDVGRLTSASGAALARLAPLLDARRSGGLVRHCHGDLHLRNIVVIDGRAVLFDAIEFDPAFANIDVLYDLAFLVMDLQYRGLDLLASIVLNRYLDSTGDAGGLAALPLFLATRAAIRSHIDAVAAGSQSQAESARDLAERARRYLNLALSFLQPVQPHLVAIGGLSGSGKSRLGRELAPLLGAKPGARIVRTDSTRKRLAGVSLATRLGSQDYSAEMSRRTYQAVYDEAATALAAGRSVIADAVFATPEERAAIERVAEQAGVPFCGLWLQASPQLLEQRVIGRRNNVSDATPEVVRLQLSFDLGDIAWTRLDSSGEGDQTLRAALAVLKP